MAVPTMDELLEAGAHFGHQTRRWNPKMKKFIFTEQNDIYIIDLQKSIRKMEEARAVIRQVVDNRQSVLFVGTKKQAGEVIKEEAGRCGQYYVIERWLGGMLTNYKTISKSIQRLNKLEKMHEDGITTGLTKKELGMMDKKRVKLQKVLGGIREMKGVPGCIFIVDITKEKIAVQEAKKLGIPVVAIVDTNADPESVDCAIPANDDAIRSIKLITRFVADTIMEGNRKHEVEDEMKAKAKAAKSEKSTK